MASSVSTTSNTLQNRNDGRELGSLLADMRTDIVSVRTPLAGLLTGSAVYDAASIADGAGLATTVTVTGAALGDFAFVSLGVDAAGLIVTAYVSAADTVAVRLQNENAGAAVDLASTTIRAVVWPYATMVAAAALLTSA